MSLTPRTLYNDRLASVHCDELVSLPVNAASCVTAIRIQDAASQPRYTGHRPAAACSHSPPPSHMSSCVRRDWVTTDQTPQRCELSLCIDLRQQTQQPHICIQLTSCTRPISTRMRKHLSARCCCRCCGERTGRLFGRASYLTLQRRSADGKASERPLSRTLNLSVCY